MEDLDQNFVLSFKERVNLRFPKKRYLEMDNAEFLIEIGACTRVRSTGELKIKCSNRALIKTYLLVIF